MRTKKITAFLAGAAMMANPLSALADCPNAVALNVGDKVTDCPRIGLSLDYDRQVRKDLVDGDYNKQIVDQQKKIIDLKDLQIKQMSDQAELWRTEALREREVLNRERDKTNWGLWGGLIGGIALTVMAGWAIGQASR